MNTPLEVKSSSEEITGWSRTVTALFNNKEVTLHVYWNDYDGVQAGTPSYFVEWSAEEKRALKEWLSVRENVWLLDELTSN